VFLYGSKFLGALGPQLVGGLPEAQQVFDERLDGVAPTLTHADESTQVSDRARNVQLPGSAHDQETLRL